MALIPKPKRKARFMNGTCIAIDDLGYFDAHYGTVRRVKYTFKTDQLNDDGHPLIVARVFNDDMCRTAWQRKAIHRWLGEAMPNDKARDFDRNTLLNTTCRLKLTPVPKRTGWHEVEIYGPPAKGRRRKERNNN